MILKCSYRTQGLCGCALLMCFCRHKSKIKIWQWKCIWRIIQSRVHIAHEEACSIEVIQLEFIKTCSVGIQMHVMSGAQSWIIRLVSLYEKHNPGKNFKCTWRIILKSSLMYFFTNQFLFIFEQVHAGKYKICLLLCKNTTYGHNRKRKI